MSFEFHPISFGFVDVFLLKGEKNVLIDARMSGQIKRLRQSLAAVGTPLEEIDLLLFTHGHFDHIGMAREIVDASGAQTAINQREKSWLENGAAPLPPGVTPWGKFLILLMGMAVRGSLPPVAIDLALGDENFSLAAYGIPGQVIYTPGHTLGSMSVLLDNGDAIVGDLAMNHKLLRLTPGAPIFAEDIGLVPVSWQKLLDAGAKTIYPSHGKPFSADVFRKLLVTK